jgi:RNA polymerase sigma factor (sigma-70 family)
VLHRVMRMEAKAFGGRQSHPQRPQDGFEEFFRANYACVVRIAYGVVGDSHTAQDVAQDVFIAAERRFGDAQGSPHAAAWVRLAAVHTGLNAQRGRRRRDRRHMRSGTGVESAGPEELVIDRLSREEVRAALSRLPRRAASVLVLRHSGLSYAEVAEAMGVGIGQVGTMLRRAEAALRREVERATRD